MNVCMHACLKDSCNSTHGTGGGVCVCVQAMQNLNLPPHLDAMAHVNRAIEKLQSAADKMPKSMQDVMVPSIGKSCFPPLVDHASLHMKIGRASHPLVGQGSLHW